jgi:hypothetical protein
MSVEMVRQDGKAVVTAWRGKNMRIEPHGAYICEPRRLTPKFFSPLKPFRVRIETVPTIRG